MVLTLVYGAFLVYAFDVTRETTLMRAEGPRLQIRPEHHDRPHDASFERSMWIDFHEIPPVLVAAVLHREDRRFGSHIGIDVIGIARAIVGFGQAGGGSTITQQIAKMLFVGRDRTLLRKIDEMFVALWLDVIFAKEELLEIYLNTVYLGDGVRGVEAASRKHFGFSLKRSRAEAARMDAVMAAQLAVALSNPIRFDPRSTRDAGRIAALLAQMRQSGFDLGRITPDEASVRRLIAGRKRAEKPPVPVAAAHRDRSVAQAARVAPNAAAVYEAATYLRSDHQIYLEKEIATYRRTTKALDRDYPNVLGYVIDLETGGVTAQVGHSAQVYPGSLTKPFILLCAYLEGMKPNKVVIDEPYGDPPQITNRGRGYFGRITLERALALSVNSVFARLVDTLGIDCLTRMATALSAPMWLSSGGAEGTLGRRTLALGAAPVELAGLLDGYLALATCGRLTRHSHLAALWRPGRFAAGWSSASDPHTPNPQLHTAIADVQRGMQAAATIGTAHVVGEGFPRGRVAAKTGTDDEGRQFAIVAFTSRWMVYLSFWTDRPREPGRIARPGASLAPAMAQLLVNLHIGVEANPLACVAGRSHGMSMASR